MPSRVRPLLLALLALAGGAAAGVPERRVPALASEQRAAALDPAGRLRAARSLRARGTRAPGVAPVVDRAAVREALRAGGRGTYIGELLLDHDSTLTRWPERVARPITVWIQPAAPYEHFQPRFPELVRSAFVDWQRTGIPVRFAFVDDSASAEVHVTWVERFDEPISGKTLWTRDGAWWIVDAEVQIAVRHNAGRPLDAASVKAIALHEVGHLLGLDHTSDPANIMTPRIRVRDLSAADRSTLRLLYAVPPGAVR